MLAMAPASRRPGEIRDAILAALADGREASIKEIQRVVEDRFGAPVARSSVRSSLALQDELFVRTGRGRYRLRR